MLVLIPIALAFQVQIGVSTGKPKADSIRARTSEAEATLEEVSGRRRNTRTAVNVPVTDALRASAFKDPGARDLLLRARKARLRQDAALLSYDATTYQRLSVGLGFKAFGRERLAMRHEDASRVQWQRGRGALVEVKGNRTVVPIAGETGGGEVNGLSPIPYYPGREQLWIGGGLARTDVDEREFVHPIAEGAEAYYTYATGDSVIMMLPDSTRLVLRELKIQARYPKWNLSVGSFWFDEKTAHLVRAVYRISSQLDVWALADDETARAKADTTPRDNRRGPGTGRNNRNNEGVPWMVKAMLSPMKVDITAITLEYGLYNQRFWMPRAQAFEGNAQAGFMRIPVTMEQKFKYATVNALDSVPTVPEMARPRLAILRDSLDSAKTPRALRDTLLATARRARAKEIQVQHDRDCAATGAYTTLRRRYEGTVNVTTRVPCDSAVLANAPELPASIYDSGEEIFGSAERESLIKALSFGLQPGWGPQKPTLEYGLSYTRYNRVEGLSTGLGLKSVLGRGYTADLGVRASYADQQINGDVSLSRTNGRSTITGTVYRRLEAANDWGTPLSFGASLASLLYGRDEGAYFRTWGAELKGTTPTLGSLEWRLFAEQQSKAEVKSRWTLFGGGNDVRFIANPLAQKAAEFGGSVRVRSSAGLDPNGWRLLSDVRVEGAGGDFSYARGLTDVTVSHAISSRFAGAVTASAGYSGGTLPVQRLFYLGGSPTVRGQTALTASGDAFWLGRAEVGARSTAVKPVIFADLGWAGDRRDWSKPGRPLSGVGTGVSFLDGLFRVDLARGLYPAKQWRLDFYLEARF